ncbi:MAG: hypothetical protein MUF21_03390 [Gemmatimonadaceae bacterium]|jgi:hypothetical protein|nr:hypothetical protein [Gemmatimonadaceae bacterium]
MPRVLPRLVTLAGLLALVACAERTDGSSACPSLCTDPTLAVRDTVFDAVTLDTAFGGFPLPGALQQTVDPYLPLVRRGDTADVRLVFRFDSLPQSVSTTDTTPVTRVRSAALLVTVDSTAIGARPADGVTIDLFDVDTVTAADSIPATMAPLFRPDRRIGGGVITAAQTRDLVVDTLRIDDAVVLDRIRRGARLRIGVQARGSAPVAIRLLDVGSGAAGFVPRLRYDASPNDTVRERLLFTRSLTPTASAGSYRSQVLVVRGTAPLGGGALEVGGLPAWRSYLAFAIPRRFFDSVTVVRATLDLVQRPRRDVAAARDTVGVRPRLVTAGREITDVRQQVALLNAVLEGARFPVVPLVPADSGLRNFDVGPLLNAWATRADTLAPQALVLFSEGEGVLEAPFAFWSREAPQASLRPRLRVTYAPRRPTILP